MRASANPSNARPTTTILTAKTDKTEVSPSELVAGDGEVVANAVVKPPRPDDKKLHWYRVTKGGYIGADGVRARLPVGKELHDGAYNIKQLRKQGIELEDLGEGPAHGPVESDAPQAAAG